MNLAADRLSSLPDDIINKILSYIETKDAIKTSILSSRWKYTWKSIPHFNFDTHDILIHYASSLSMLLMFCLPAIMKKELSSVKLCFRGEVSQAFVEPIMNYAFSHNVQKMTIICSYGKQIEFPLSLFISQSLKDLTLFECSISTTIKSSWDLPTLTTLHFDRVNLSNVIPFQDGESTSTEVSHAKDDVEYGGLFSKRPNLKNLTLSDCNIYVDDFTIYHSQLSNFSIKNGRSYSVVNVVAPHLKDLTVVKFKGDFMISAPKLSSLTYESEYYTELYSAYGFSSLEKVDFYISCPYDEDAPKIIHVLQQFGNVKYFTLGLEVVEVFIF
ncbi:FBD-associated F-box protein At3g52670-like [Rutidosis leptorrhynchoides]|uniref:FBD-associated F-box protein At3g52670-like n=1 Tax=Rutidosis leptorrhynchoides TaxID=125765 RepID=UPI003A996D2A